MIAQHRNCRSRVDHRGRRQPPLPGATVRPRLRRLVEIDRAHGTLSGPATKSLAERAVSVHGQTEFAALSGSSVAHLYNLRHSAGHEKARVHFTATTAPRTPVAIGIRKRPDPQCRAAFLRIDSVHQGDHEVWRH